MCSARRSAPATSPIDRLADGKPVYWVGRAGVASRIGHVPGPDLLLRALEAFKERRHFFFGSTPEVLALLTEALWRAVPGLNVCGSLSPPFRPPTVQERLEHLETIRRSRADFVWVGLGAPKQEFWMAENWRELAPCILLGVGAAFEFHAGTVRRAPEGFRRLGLEWLYRLAKEPRRLWKRYLITNSLFLLFLLRETLGGRRGRASS